MDGNVALAPSCLHQLRRALRSPAGGVELAVMMQLDDLGPGHVARGLGGKAHHQHRPDGKVGGDERVGTALGAGVHVVIGTTGFDPEPLHAEGGANAFVAPNFAIGAVLMMRFAAEAARHMHRAEIVELHHDGKLDAPSGTAKRTAELMQTGAREVAIPIHSIRLPGLVAYQVVILGYEVQTLTIRHDTTSRECFMPGVLLAIRKVGSLTESPVVGLEHLL